MTCRYRFILMGANTVRDAPVLPLREFNESIRVLPPLHRLSSARRPHHRPHPERERERITAFTADIPYLWSQRRLLLLDDQLSIIQLARLHTHHRNVVLFS